MKRNAIRVSAIIIVLDGEAYLEEAVLSIQGQTYRDWELIIVDDGSSDATLPIARKFAQSDARIRVLQHPDRATRGMSETRNLGLGAAAGEYAAFLDADDVWMPDKLSEQVDLLDRNPSAAMVYGRTLIWSGASGEKDFFYELGVTPDQLYQPPTLFLQLLENRYQSPTTCNAMFRLQPALAAGGFDNRFRGMFEDQLFFAKLLASYPTYVSGRTWAKYRQHEMSSSALTAPRDVLKAQLSYLRAVRTFLVDKGKSFSRERLAVELKMGALFLQEVRDGLKSRARNMLG